ncbi:MAG TPA: family 78 glycoside hydrolase catalytic domain [Lachnospiraceae bacterium]|nr:family 78 glycoside hydrolase catalytic domain [Lachnospiraceae bacterium]
MKIENIRINGIENPVGYSLPQICVSWKVTDTVSKKAVISELTVIDEEGKTVCFSENADSTGCRADFVPSPEETYTVRIRVTGDKGDTAEGEAFFETGKGSTAWLAKWISPDEGIFHPVFKKKFFVEKPVKKARFYGTGVGLFEVSVNGRKLGEEYLCPGLSAYESQLHVFTFLADQEVRAGENEVSFLLGKGWFLGQYGPDGGERLYGDCTAALGELVLTYEDGTKETIATDETWTWSESRITESGIYYGETIDETRAADGASAAEETRAADGASAAGETRAADGASAAGETRAADGAPAAEETRAAGETKTAESGRPAILTELTRKGCENLAFSHLTDRIALPVKIKEKIPVREVIRTPKGETVLDFGQNFAGFPEVHLHAPKGTHLVLSFGEILQDGCFYNGNYREARSSYDLISDGTDHMVRPHFTFFGFRYVKVEGLPEVSPADFTGCVLYSDLTKTGDIETSNTKINRLFENTLWGLKSNFIDIPTDCPQRNERLGWTGDAQVFSPTASYHVDTRAFFHKFENDLMREQQFLDGGVPNYLPNVGHKKDCTSVWGDIATFLPDMLYRYYGSKEELSFAYPLMTGWVSYLKKLDDGSRFPAFSFQFGDWLALDGVSPSSFSGGTDSGMIGCAYYYASVKKTREAAEVLGNSEDAGLLKRLENEIKEAFIKEYYTPTGRFAQDTQTSYVIALHFGLFPDKAYLIRQFRERLKKDCFKIKCGFVGAPLLLMTLGENGLFDEAYTFLLNEEFPGWLYEVNHGATTVWERWNSVGEDGKINPAGMNSLNHYAYGSVMEFAYAYAGGIRPLAPGFKKALIAPNPDIRLPKVKVSYDSVSGRYVSETELLADGSVRLRVEVPFGASALLKKPGSKAEEELLPGIYDFQYLPEKDYRRPYSGSSSLIRLSENQEALDILRKNCPPLFGMAVSHNAEFGWNTVEEMRIYKFMGITDETIDTIERELENLTVKI